MPRVHRSPRTAVFATLVAVVALAGWSLVPVHAASPKEGKLDLAHRTITWTGGPMVGSADALRRITCDSPLACEDFFLDVNLPANAFAGAGRVPVMDMTLTPSANQIMDIVVCVPGACTPIVPGTPIRNPSVTDYNEYPPESMTVNGQTIAKPGGISHGRIQLPKKGVWTIRAGCQVCLGATYSMTVKVDTAPAPKGLSSFVNKFLPGPDPKTTEGAAEPGIQIGPKGEIWVNGPGNTADFWGSYDGGKKFTLHQPVHDFSDGDTWLTIGPTGTLYAINLVLEAGLSNHVYVSHDHGQTWEVLAELPGNHQVPYIVNAESDRQWITADPKHPGTIYFEAHDFDPVGVWVYKSTNDGKTWVPTSEVTAFEPVSHTSVDSMAGNTTTPILFSPDGNTMYFTIAASDFVPGVVQNEVPTNPDFPLTKIFVVSSTDGGLTWAFHTAYDSAGAEYIDHGFTPMSIDRKGNLYLTWSARPVSGVITTEYLATSTDQGKTWSKPVQVSSKGNSNVFPAIGAKGDPGRVDIAWLESPLADFNDRNSTWTVVLAQSTNALSSHPTFIKSSVSKGIVHAADICQAGTLCLATSGNRNLLDYIYMDIDNAGMAHIVYANDLGDLQTVYANQVAGAGTLLGRTVKRLLPKVTLPKVKGTKQTRLPATGVGGGMIGLVLVVGAAVGAAFTRRLRRTT